MSENMENMEVQQPVEEIVAEPVSAEIVEEPKKSVNVLGIIGFIAGVLAMVMCCCNCWLQLGLGIAAIILCAIGMVKGKKADQNIVLAIIGLILGILGAISGLGTAIYNLIVGGMNFLSYLVALMAEMGAGY